MRTENAETKMSLPLQTKMKENCIHRWKNVEVIRDSEGEFTHINLSEELKGKDYLRLKLIFS